MQGELKTFWQLLYTTIAMRARQASYYELPPHHPRNSIAPDLEPYVGSTTWPHDNTPLPAVLVHFTESHPTPYNPLFDALQISLDEPPVRFVVACSCGCIGVSLMFIIFFATIWCPTDYESPESQILDPPVACTPVDANGNVVQTRNETVACALQSDPGEYIDIADACGVTKWRYIGLGLLLIVMGIPALVCFTVLVRLVWKQFVFYLFPLKHQQYRNFPPAVPTNSEEPELALVHHLRALTLLYTVHKLSRRPLQARNPCVPKWLWDMYHTHHFQWACVQGHDQQDLGRVWRFSVYADGTVDEFHAPRENWWFW